MRKMLCAVFALILLLCAAGFCEAEDLPAFSLSDHVGMRWTHSIDIGNYPYACEESLAVYAKDQAVLTHNGVDYRVKETGGTCVLEKDVYASPFDEKPSLTLNAGEIRFSGTDAKVRVEAVSDPLGIFAGFSEEDLTLSLYPYSDLIPSAGHTPSYQGTGPHFQPGTVWFEQAGHRTAEGSVVWYQNCRLETKADGTVSGTVQPYYLSEKDDCSLLWSQDAAALMRSDGELLFYGALVSNGRNDDRDRCAALSIKADYDPYLLSAGGTLILYKRVNEYMTADVIGRNRYQIIADLAENDWIEAPLSMKNGENDYSELFLKLTRGGETLLIYLETDYGGRFGAEQYALSYVLTGLDGTLESWGGLKPADHTLADTYRGKDPFPFAGRTLCGLLEDDDIVPLDDGRILVTYSGHESGEVLNYFILDPRG